MPDDRVSFKVFAEVVQCANRSVSHSITETAIRRRGHVSNFLPERDPYWLWRFLGGVADRWSAEK